MRLARNASHALSCNPSLLIADEPTTALDMTVQAQPRCKEEVPPLTKLNGQHEVACHFPLV